MYAIRSYYGLANAEAQAAGTPVVAYDVAAVPEVVEKGVSGWLAPLGSIDGLAAAIAEAMDDPARTRRAMASASEGVDATSPSGIGIPAARKSARP